MSITKYSGSLLRKSQTLYTCSRILISEYFSLQICRQELEEYPGCMSDIGLSGHSLHQPLHIDGSSMDSNPGMNHQNTNSMYRGQKI